MCPSLVLYRNLPQMPFPERCSVHQSTQKSRLGPFSDKTMVKRQLIFSLIPFDQLLSQRESTKTIVPKLVISIRIKEQEQAGEHPQSLTITGDSSAVAFSAVACSMN